MNRLYRVRMFDSRSSWVIASTVARAVAIGFPQVDGRDPRLRVADETELYLAGGRTEATRSALAIDSLTSLLNDGREAVVAIRQRGVYSYWAWADSRLPLTDEYTRSLLRHIAEMNQELVGGSEPHKVSEPKEPEEVSPFQLLAEALKKKD